MPTARGAAEYAKLRLQHECISIAATASLPPAANLYRDRALERLAPGAAAMRSMRGRMLHLEGQLFGGVAPATESPEFAEAVAELAQ